MGTIDSRQRERNEGTDMKQLAGIAMICAWMAGIVYAAGWMKLVAIFLAPYAWYLVAERILM